MARHDADDANSWKETAPPSPREPVDGSLRAGDITQILGAVEKGDGQAAGQLLPLVYSELRKLAAAKMAREKPGQTLQPTALVHEAFLRLVQGETSQSFTSRAHFFAAAAEAMRRILVETARSKKRQCRGGNAHRSDLLEGDAIVQPQLDQVLDLDAALTKLTEADAMAGKLVELRVFAGMTLTSSSITIRERCTSHLAVTICHSPSS